MVSIQVQPGSEAETGSTATRELLDLADFVDPRVSYCYP